MVFRMIQYEILDSFMPVNREFLKTRSQVKPVSSSNLTLNTVKIRHFVATDDLFRADVHERFCGAIATPFVQVHEVQGKYEGPN